ncbi:hypothetical protein [Kallotenue papyrolyticum]|uniref:hypothetical protein n=1 Tax=Kallotenue papyrolyticum TaxID=1325125 RepID=UPI000478531C|nr:hypothetical protein [Kallotenue papyrolyticum]
MPSPRVEATLERLQEHEALTADLPDPAASALLAWITRQVAAADAAPTEERFAAQVNAIRQAARQAARQSAQQTATRSPSPPEPTAVVARAQELLRQQGDPELIALPPEVDAPPATSAPPASVPASPAAAELSRTPSAPQATPPAGVSNDPTALVRRAPRAASAQEPPPATPSAALDHRPTRLPAARAPRLSLWSRLRRRWRWRKE